MSTFVSRSSRTNFDYSIIEKFEKKKGKIVENIETNCPLYVFVINVVSGQGRRSDNEEFLFITVSLKEVV